MGSCLSKGLFLRKWNRFAQITFTLLSHPCILLYSRIYNYIHRWKMEMRQRRRHWLSLSYNICMLVDSRYMDMSLAILWVVTITCATVCVSALDSDVCCDKDSVWWKSSLHIVFILLNLTFWIIEFWEDGKGFVYLLLSLRRMKIPRLAD